MVHDNVLKEIETDSFRAYAVWEPILRADSEQWAKRSTSILSDPRVTHFWIDNRDVGKLFQAPIGLTTEPAWDVYLLYPSGVEWTDSPPTPYFFMHQLGNRLPQENRLSGEGLASRVRRLLSTN